VSLQSRSSGADIGGMRLYPRAATSWKMYRRGRVDGRLPIVPTVAGTFPEEVAARLDAVTEPLRAAGFVHERDYGPRDYRATVVNHAQVFAHPVELIRAWAMDFQTEFAIQTCVELATRLPDGTIVCSVNHTAAPVFDRPEWSQVEVLPGVPVKELLSAHRARVANLPTPPAPPWDEDPLTTAQREHDAILAYQAERGILSRQKDDYGYTGRGAIRSVERVAKAMSDEPDADPASP
jgi:hypothetical protein